jgi:hypothetical protein
MVRVDPGGAALRAVRTNVHQRRQYSVAGPNSLWHFDGNHKFVRYGLHKAGLCISLLNQILCEGQQKWGKSRILSLPTATAHKTSTLLCF